MTLNELIAEWQPYLFFFTTGKTSLYTFRLPDWPSESQDKILVDETDGYQATAIGHRYVYGPGHKPIGQKFDYIEVRFSVIQLSKSITKERLVNIREAWKKDAYRYTETDATTGHRTTIIKPKKNNGAK